MSSPRVYFRCTYCRRRVMAARVMAARWLAGDPRACDACVDRSPTEAIADSICRGTYPRRPRPE